MSFTNATLVFLGMTGMMTLYVGGQAIVTGERAYRWYTAYALCWSCYFVVKVFDPFEATPYDTVVYGCCRVVIPMIAYVCYYSFADALLNFRRNLPVVYRLFQRTQAVLLLYVLAETGASLVWPGWVVMPVHEWLHSVVRIGVAVVSVIGIVNATHRRDTLVNYFLVGSSMLLVGALTSMVMTMIMPNDEDTGFGSEPLLYLQIGITLELLCFSLGLSYKNKLTEVEKATAEQALLLEREQRNVAQLRAHFFTNVSHEFRTPLTLLIGPLAQLIQENPLNSTFQLMHRQATRLLTLVNQLLDLTKLDAGQLRPHLMPGHLPRFLRGLAGSFSSLADSRDVRLLIETDEQPPTALYDSDKVEKIVQNLIANALKFTPAGGLVRFSYHYDATRQQATIQVADTGPGIAPEQQARIFERFYQSPQTVQSGTGIGLALVQELVAVLGGQVSLSSPPGEGATFTLLLPVSETSASEAGEAVLTEDNGAPTRPNNHAASLAQPYTPAAESDTGLIELPLLLLIDDNADVREYLRMLFASSYRVLEASTGRSGLAVASELLPDMVVSDLMMPDMDGLAFCHHLRHNPATDHIPVILLTAKADVDSRIEGLRTGADDYLAKPFHPVELQTRVQNLLV
ncbi:response regulator [Fibrella sp. HMF5335]|uniref:histidine kinase n=1 Tax=Fibrella rubiginis TaxID=2817060 RepID=A0A939GCJ4_9BACT|nr:ATP-binding protein [Fibrella rubiginis]MBO0935836.1 response regulator [Fibrella rubiginis]